ncbi:MAG: hypothetical protein ACRC0Y_03870 [Fusobacteriaceae bacterium]
MAREIKDVKGTFDFTGLLVKKELKKNDDPSKNGKFTFNLLDKEIGSEVKLELWEGSEGTYWDMADKKVVRVDKDRVATVMKEVLATATGKPFDTKVIANGKETSYYIPNDLITNLNKLVDNKYVLNVTGAIGFKTYNGRVQKEYKIQKIEIGSKKAVGFKVQLPVVVANTTKDKFVFGEMLNTLPVLVKAKLQEGGFGHRAIQLGLDKNYFLDGLAVEVAKKVGKNTVEMLNKEVMPNVIEGMKVNQGYVSALLNGRLKVGEITKKPTVEDLNPMEMTILNMLGEEAINDKLNGMDMVTEYFDSLYFHSFDAIAGSMFENINESELRLPSDTQDVQTTISNPMLDAMASIMNQAPVHVEEATVEVVNKVEEVKIAESSELEDLINEAESEVTGTTENDEDEFPF